MAGVDYRQGDYRVVAQRLRPAAERLVQWCAGDLGDLVVDVAAGSGNVAHLCAQRGARVVAVDRVPEQLALGRTGDDGIAWVAGDAHALPVRDGSASAAFSTFGLIYAGQPDLAVAEMARACRTGAVLGLTTWPSGHFQQASGDALKEHVDLRAPGHDHIAQWGTAEAIADRLRAVAYDIEVEEGLLESHHASVEAWWEERTTCAPPIVSARQQLDAASFAELGRQMRAIAQHYGRRTPDGFVLRDAYLVARARVR